MGPINRQPFGGVYDEPRRQRHIPSTDERSDWHEGVLLQQWTTVDGVPHARLIYRDETLAVSVSTLADPQFFMTAPATQGQD